MSSLIATATKPRGSSDDPPPLIRPKTLLPRLPLPDRAVVRGVGAAAVKRYWLSWYSDSPYGFEYHGPWWQSGWRCGDDTDTPVYVAAVQAESEEGARTVIYMAYAAVDAVADPMVEWRFVNERANDWTPFATDGEGRFPKAEWMQWP